MGPGPSRGNREQESPILHLDLDTCLAPANATYRTELIDWLTHKVRAMFEQRAL